MTLKVISSAGEGLYKEKGSKFIGFVFHVESREDIDAKLREMAEQYPDARHVCYAFRLGENADTEFANDDGEPRNSAGQPILNQLRSVELTNVLGVVIRYFGGKKLGVSGLIHAYKGATSDALSNCRTKVFKLEKSFELTFPISSMGSVELIGRKLGWKLDRSDYGEECQFTVVLANNKCSELIDFLKREGIQYLEIKKPAE